MKGFDKMKMLAFGKDCGSFPNEHGEIVEYWKVSGVKLADYVEQVNDGVRITVGGICNRFSCTSSVFNSLPDDAQSYDGGLMLDVDFDDKKKIVGVDLADED